MMDLYFESAGMILTLITLGKTLEARAKGKTSDAITKLMNLLPKRLSWSGTEKSFRCRWKKCSWAKPDCQGRESVPVDGIVIEGFSSVDESADRREHPVRSISGTK